MRPGRGAGDEGSARSDRLADGGHRIADRAGEFGRTYRQSHQGIEVDLLLAAAAERFGAELLTRSARHFPMFPGLRPAF